MAILTLHDIQKIIPHRAPILLVEKVLNWETHKIINAQRFFKKNDASFLGHFPDNPLLPGVLGIEALAQASALLINLSENKIAKETQFLFRGIEKAKFRQQILPETTIDIEVRETKSRAGLYFFEGRISVDGVLCTEAEFTAKHIVL